MSGSKAKLLVSAAVAFSVVFGAGLSAMADEVIVTSHPFYARSEFPTEHGYFRTDDGHYYHYDKDRDGWHHGRNHREGVRRDRHH